MNYVTAMTFYNVAFSNGAVIGFETLKSAETYAALAGIKVVYFSPLSTFAVTMTVAA